MNKVLETNPELLLAQDYINKTNQNIFLTGKAGTGKTTFLHQLKNTCLKKMIITAPTGVAAINATGVTIHSFFQLPFGPIPPEREMYTQSWNPRFTKDKISIIKSLDLLIIDEISMVRADVLDAIDKVLRQLRRSQVAFGGVQLLMIGDLYQLSPIINPADWKALEKHYKSIFYFESKALAKSSFSIIELKKIYRQNNQAFIDILNQVRVNGLNNLSRDILMKRYIPNFIPPDNEDYITLTTHNKKADSINYNNLQNINTKSKTYIANIEGTFSEQNYPTQEKLELKVQSQVMFVKNDNSADKRFFNGKIGIITRLTSEHVYVKCKDDPIEIIVKKLEWKNIKYTVDSQEGKITEEVIGSFTQIPLRLAWSITVHKSQGLSFDRAIIDVEKSFAFGQVYVALSRCRSLEGMILAGPINEIKTSEDHHIRNFFLNQQEKVATIENLQKHQNIYQQQLIYECFNFQKINQSMGRLNNYSSAPSSILQIFYQEIVLVGEKFSRELYSLFQLDILPESNEKIQERIIKASKYFNEKYNELLDAWINNLNFSSTNKDEIKKFNYFYDNFKQEYNKKKTQIKSCMQGFRLNQYLDEFSKINLKNITSSKQSKKIVEKVDTKDISFQLFKKDMSINEIASYRNLAESTIVLHLAHYVQEGKIDIYEFIDDEKLEKIVNAFDIHGYQSIDLIKSNIDRKISYAQIHLVKAYYISQE